MGELMTGDADAAILYIREAEELLLDGCDQLQEKMENMVAERAINEELVNISDFLSKLNVIADSLDSAIKTFIGKCN